MDKKYCTWQLLKWNRFILITSLNPISIVNMIQDKASFCLFLQLTVEVSNLPPLTGLKCYIHGKERVTTVLSGNVVKCGTPSVKELPSISSDTGKN